MRIKSKKKVIRDDSYLPSELGDPAAKIKELEEKLQETEKKFGEVQSIANIGFWELDIDNMTPIWTDGVFSITGFEPTEDGKLNYIDQKSFVYPDDWDNFYNATQAIIATGEDTELDVRAMRPDGSIRVIHIIAKPKKDKNGNIVTIRGTAQDITDLKTIENELKKSEAFYKTLFEYTGNASIIIDKDTTISRVNTQFEHLSGYSKGEIEGKKSWKEFVPEEDIQIIKNYHYMRRKSPHMVPECYEARFINKRGEIKNILINAAIIPGTKKSLASIVDLTERKKMEKKLADSERIHRYIVESATVGIFILEKQGNIKYVNEYMALLLGYKKTEMLNNHIKNFLKENEDFLKLQKQCNNDIHEYNGFKFLNRDGDIFWANLTCSPILNSGKEYMGMIGVITDVNIQKKLEKTILEREEVFKGLIYEIMEIVNNLIDGGDDLEFKDSPLDYGKTSNNN